jgi:pimeloyl-ACP methyl ester carboxylesterase
VGRRAAGAARARIGGSARYWRPLAEVSAGYRATAPDLLGFGRSPRPDDSAYDVREHLAALLPLVEPGSVVVAHSTGAVLAAALAAARPDLVSALLLVGAPLYADVPSARSEVRRLGSWPRSPPQGTSRAGWRSSCCMAWSSR